MNLFKTAIFLLISGHVHGQKKQCYCGKNTLMNGATVSCETRVLKNNSQLYWQYNCDKIWLTLESNKGKKIVIDEVGIELFGYTYRLGYHLIKEYQTMLLFRSGCPANGPCIYTLVDKSNGNKVKRFNQLICINTDVKWENAHPYQYNFVVYFSEDYDSLIVYFIDTKRSLKVPFDARNNKVTSAVPEQQFIKMSKRNNGLTLVYTNDDKINKELKINLENAKYRR